MLSYEGGLPCSGEEKLLFSLTKNRTVLSTIETESIGFVQSLSIKIISPETGDPYKT